MDKIRFFFGLYLIHRVMSFHLIFSRFHHRQSAPSVSKCFFQDRNIPRDNLVLIYAN